MVIGAVGAESALCMRLCARGAALAVGLAAWLALAVGQGKAEGPQSGAEFRECSGCPAMIVIPAGRCSMGSSKDDADARANERPPHEVRIAGPIAVAKFAATFDEWDACAAAGACPRVPDGWRRGQIPVINVSWNDAKQ
jgi:formylglycine-generating enzyme required for sulfatase activity